MKIKVGTTWSKLCPERFKNNKNQRPIPMIELWFDDAEKLRIQRDGFVMPRVEDVLTLHEAIQKLDPCNAIRKATCRHDYVLYRYVNDVMEAYCAQCDKEV